MVCIDSAPALEVSTPEVEGYRWGITVNLAGLRGRLPGFSIRE